MHLGVFILYPSSFIFLPESAFGGRSYGPKWRNLRIKAVHLYNIVACVICEFALIQQ